MLMAEAASKRMQHQFLSILLLMIFSAVIAAELRT